ncbi:outer membrane protein assembly factor BamA [Algoriphagus boseongensis]|uniref:Outer membrane protein assembly factor BamA n=1 Tax=Algoriphagus boseongensis TaxID=1442587 RepID=A0A4V3D1T8_9BACT|nr:hypothetical protein [Algoriphagus boseongensis]TDQ13729.1 outer membrane protein assembly factor BamA [Algoriphagus boseongensis]
MKLKLFLLGLVALPFLGYGQQSIRISWIFPQENQHELWLNNQDLAGRKIDSLVNFFQSQGYLETRYDSQISSDTSFVNFHLGPLYSWSELAVESVPIELIQKFGKPGLSYQEPYLWIDKLIKDGENQGFPFAQAKIDSIVIREKRLSGIVVFDPGPLIVWDSLEINSGSKTKRNYLQLLSGLAPGEAFSQEKFDKTNRRLRQSPYFSFSNPPELSFQYQKARPFYSLRERQINIFDGIIGFLPNENEPGKLLVTGQIDLQLYHLAGKGRDFSLQWQRLNVQSQSLELAFKEAFVFRSLLDFGAQFSLLKQDSSFVNRTFELDFGYRISDSGYLNFFTKRQAGDLIDSGVGSDLQELPQSIDYRWNQYGIRGEWTNLDDRIFPRRGWNFSANFAVGNKRILDNTAIPEELYEGLEENSLQMQGFFGVENHIFIKPQWGMYFRGEAGFIDNNQLFLNEFFRLGGLKSIRGFNEKFFFAKSYGLLSMEQRLYFGQSSYLLAFADFGMLSNPYNSPKNDKPFSFGSGINLDTGGGLFSFVFALGKSTIQPLSFEYARIHFGYLARF